MARNKAKVCTYGGIPAGPGKLTCPDLTGPIRQQAPSERGSEDLPCRDSLFYDVVYFDDDLCLHDNHYHSHNSYTTSYLVILAQRQCNSYALIVAFCQKQKTASCRYIIPKAEAIIPKEIIFQFCCVSRCG